MQPLFETERLRAYVSGVEFAKPLLAYEKGNLQACKPFSMTHQSSYYTLASFQDICSRQASLCEQKRMLPLLFFFKEDQKHVVGTVFLNHIVWGASLSAKIGYSIDHRLWRQGYGTEAVSSVVSYAFEHMELHRLEAHIMSSNEASRRLVTRLGFLDEGVCRGYLFLNGRWEDHIRYALCNN
ncbi:MAG: GNAT family N-acetyltransferase [Spirochaetales bacterium]|nr:GNAT family N-acetyltransferase [Spirochaetales bacterium]